MLSKRKRKHPGAGMHIKDPNALSTGQLYNVPIYGLLPRKAQTQCARVFAVAIRRNVLPRAIDASTLCADCGRAAVMYDHRDYSRPLDVVAVCHSCNLRRGAALPLTRKENGHPMNGFAASMLEVATEPFD